MPDQPLHYYCGEAALDELTRYCRQNQLDRFILISDTNTHPVLGQRTTVALQSQGWQVREIILEGPEVVADESYLQYVLDRSESKPWVFLSVGSGTLTDIARYCSYQKNTTFICLPSAPSVDGFASVVAPIVVKGFKDTVPAQAPQAIFADLPTLCAAPKAMIAAGMGDMLGKYTSLADWKLDHILWGEPYDSQIAARLERALLACVENVEGVRQADPQGIANLLGGLVESGICMIQAGNSRPASGAEHHLSHFWEMKLLRQSRPAVLHGAKVGVGTVLTAGRWEQVRALSLQDVEQRLSRSRLPSLEQERQAIEAAFHPNTEPIYQNQTRFLELSEANYTVLKEKIHQNWGEIKEIAARVPMATRMIELFEQVGGPTQVSGIGLDAQDEAEALRYAHYLRNQFTVAKLGRILGLWE